ncbi:HEAT repeat-containing protein 6 isoform X2 [Dermacentor andersoni]|uniref:HEAT repeat-containing protein 6 isoform X2 n=1 Tax=Dermacentor andersoni TaxID=34620 RepID=UPI003B3BD935
MDIVLRQQICLKECYDTLLRKQEIQDGVELKQNLRKLNECNYSFQFISSRDADVIIVLLVDTLNVLHDDDLISNFGQLVFDICTKQKVTLETRTLHKAMEYFLKALSFCSFWVLTSCISACGALLYSNVPRLEQFWEQLLGRGCAFETLLSSLELDINAKLATLKALRAMTVRNPGEPYMPDAYVIRMVEILLGVLSGPCFNDSTVQAQTLVISALRCLQNIFSTKWNFPSEHLGNLLGILKSLSFFGFPGQKNRQYLILNPSPLCTHLPSVATSDESQSPSKLATPRRRNRKKKVKKGNGCLKEDTPEQSEEEGMKTPLQFWKKTSSSESEFSDSEGSQVMRQRHLQASVRRNVYFTLAYITKVVDSREMFGYWLHFLPDIPVTIGAPQTQTVLLTILKDPNPQVRVAALDLLTGFVTKYKPFLGLAAYSGSKRTAFTTLSETVAAILGEVHRCLHLAIIAENNPAQIIQLLKCLAAVVTGSPYHRLQQGLLSRVINDVAAFMDNKGVQVQVAALTVLGAVVNVTPWPKEVAVALEPSSTPGLRSNGTESTESSSNFPGSCWLAAACADKLLADMTESVRIATTAVRVEALQVLTNMCQGYFAQLMKSSDCVISAVEACLQDTNSTIKMHTLKLLGAFSKKLGEAVSVKQDEDNADVQRCLDLGRHLWLDCLLNGTLQSFLQDFSEPMLQTESCNCLSTIGTVMWDSLPDLLFLMDVGEIAVEALEDVSVRMNASWALSNVTEMLSELRKSGSEVASEVPDTFICLLGNAAIHVRPDKNQMQANAVRALGCLLQFVSVKNLENESIRNLAISSTSCLIQSLNAGLMKVRWNACYSLGCLLGSTDIVSADYVDVASVFGALLSSLNTCSNFKVRIQAAAALQVPKVRNTYGDHMQTVWCGTLTALEGTKQSVDYRELQHQEQLREQLCATICHLLSLAKSEDLTDMARAALEHECNISSAFKRTQGKSSLLELLNKSRDNVARIYQEFSDNSTAKVLKLLDSLLKEKEFTGLLSLKELEVD